MKNLIEQFKSLFTSKEQKEKGELARQQADLARKEQEEKKKVELARQQADLVRKKQEEKEKAILARKVEDKLKMEEWSKNEQSVWEEAVKVNSSKSYRDYIGAYPNGKYFEEAVIRRNDIASIEDKNKQIQELARKAQEEKEKTELAGRQAEFARKENEKKKTIKTIVALPKTFAVPKMGWSSYETQRRVVNNVIERKIQSNASDIFFMLNMGGDILTKSIHGVTSGLFEEISRHLGNQITGAEATTISIEIRKNPTWVAAFNTFIDDKSNASKGLSPLLQVFAKLSLDYYDYFFLEHVKERGLVHENKPMPEIEPINRAQKLDSITDINSFLEIEVWEEKEIRAYDDFPEAEQFYGLARNEQHEEVVKLGKELIAKYPDFHSVYRRTARSYHSLGNKQKRNEVYLLGLKKSKNKSGICANIAEHYFGESEFLFAVKWWSKAGGLQLKSGNMKDHNPFLYLAYFAEGLNMPGYEKKLLAIVDNIQQVRFNQTAANEIYRVAKSQWGKEIKTVIQKFCTDNIK